MSNAALRTFYKSHDSGVFNGMSVFLYRKDVDFYSEIYVNYYKNGGWRSAELKTPDEFLFSKTAFFVKDYNGNASHIIFSSLVGNDESVMYISKIESQGEEVTFSEPKALSFINVHTVVIGSASSVSGVIFISVVDESSRSAYAVAIDSESYDPLSSVERIAEPLSSRYFDEMRNQLTGAISLFSDDRQGCFLQLSNESENISVIKLSFNATGGLSLARIFVITEDDIGAFSGLYDKEKSILITCYSQFNSQSQNWNINGVANKVFSKQDAQQEAIYTALPLNSSPGIYYRPQVMRNETGYAVSWEGAMNLHLREFNENINATSPERYYPANKPGNHRTAAVNGRYFVGYQNDCSEPRFVGLEYKNGEI
jgi:hypothetical protein